MAKPIRVALVAALVVECVNLFALGTPPLKGYTAGHPTQFERVRDIEQMVLHFPGVLVAVGFLHLTVDFFPNFALALAFLIVFLIGYLETASLIVGGICGFRIVRNLIRTFFPDRGTG